MNKIKQRREELGLSQVELGKMIGCSQQHIQRIESGYEIGADKALRIAECLKLPIEDILSEKWKNVIDKIKIPQPQDSIASTVYEQVYTVVKAVEEFQTEHNIKINSDKKAELIAGLVKKLLITPKSEHQKVIEFAIDWEFGKQII